VPVGVDEDTLSEHGGHMLARTLMASAVVLALGAVTPNDATADVSSKNVIGAFKGQLVITKNEVSEGKNDKETIAKIKAEKLSEIKGEKNDDVVYWNFHYSAFLNRTGATKLKMEFYRDGKQLSADKQLDGIDPKSAALFGQISINEDEGLAAGKTYVIKLVTDKDVVVSSTTLVMK
jgi:hypothetical protein